MRRALTYTSRIIIASILGLFVALCALRETQAAPVAPSEKQTQNQDTEDTRVSPMPTHGPCSDCEFAWKVREMNLMLEQLRHDRVMAEIELHIKINKADREVEQKLTQQAWENTAHLRALEEEPFYKRVPDFGKYWAKALSNIFQVCLEMNAVGKSPNMKMDVGAVACKEYNSAAAIISKLGSPAQAFELSKGSFKNWCLQLAPVTHFRRAASSWSNLDSPNRYELTLTQVPVLGIAYQTGHHAMASQIYPQELELLLVHVDSHNEHMRILLDNVVALDEAKRKAEKMHIDNVSLINEASKLWEIPGCCKSEQGLSDNDPCRGRVSGQPDKYYLVTE